MGRTKLIETPDKMWEYFEAYKKATKDNPIIVGDWVGKDADKVFREKERPLTMEGFENYCFDEGIIVDLGNYFANSNNAYSGYSTICSRIRRAIKQDQIEGGMAGIYNPSITQRLNGLADNKKIDHKVEMNIPNIPDIGNRTKV